MAVLPRESDGNGHDTSWTTSTRPANPNHGTKGWNGTTHCLEVYDVVIGAWFTTAALTYPA